MSSFFILENSRKKLGIFVDLFMSSSYFLCCFVGFLEYLICNTSFFSLKQKIKIKNKKIVYFSYNPNFTDLFTDVRVRNTVTFGLYNIY